MPQRLELELERSSIFDFFETISLCTNVRNIFQLVFNTGKGLRLPRWFKPYFSVVLPLLIVFILVQGL